MTKVSSVGTCENSQPAQSICLRTDGIKVAISASRTLPIALWFVRDSHHWLRAAGDSSAGAPSAPSRPVVVPSAAPGGKPWGLAQWRWAYDTPVGSTGLFFAPMIPYRHRYGDFCPAPRATARAASARACPPLPCERWSPGLRPRGAVPHVDGTGGSQTARVSGVSLRLSRHGWRSNDTCIRWRRPGTPPPLKEQAMPPAHINPVAALPLERSDDQGILLQRMAQLTQRLLGPWEDADGQMLPRLTMAEAVAQLYEWV